MTEQTKPRWLHMYPPRSTWTARVVVRSESGDVLNDIDLPSGSTCVITLPGSMEIESIYQGTPPKPRGRSRKRWGIWIGVDDV